MNKKNNTNGLIEGVVYNEEEEKRLLDNKDKKSKSIVTELPVFPNLGE